MKRGDDMRNFFENLSYKLSVFMEGRYGRDRLYNVLSIAALVFLILSFIPPLRFFVYIALAIIIWSLFRVLSKNIPARRKELEVFEKAFHSVTGQVKLLKRKWADRNTHIYVKCPNCKTYIRLRKPPKGKTISITCPKCHNRVEKRT